jgi:hypothetical protein
VFGKLFFIDSASWKMIADKALLCRTKEELSVFDPCASLAQCAAAVVQCLIPAKCCKMIGTSVAHCFWIEFLAISAPRKL